MFCNGANPDNPIEHNKLLDLALAFATEQIFEVVKILLYAKGYQNEAN